MLVELLSPLLDLILLKHIGIFYKDVVLQRSLLMEVKRGLSQISSNFSANIYSGYGYLAIAALILGNWNIMPTLLVCLLFGIAISAGYQIVMMAELPSTYQDVIMILPYVLTLIMLMFFSKKNQSPRALGVVYDKGGR